MRTFQRVMTGITSAVSRVALRRSISGLPEAAATHMAHLVDGAISDRAGADNGPDDVVNGNASVQTPAALVSIAVCVLCGATPIEMPQRSACGHTYCYVCIFACCQQNLAWTASRTAYPSGDIIAPAVAACLCPVCDAVVAKSVEGS